MKFGDGKRAGKRSLRKQLDRRGFLKGAGTIIAAAPLALASEVPRELFQFHLDGEPELRAEARLSPSEFLAHYEPALRARRISIGTSFAPEWLGVTPARARPRAEQQAMQVLRGAVEDLGMRDIRLGLRWSNLSPDGASLSTFYRPYLDYVFGHADVRHVVLDIGPLKTFRWPEIHVPRAVIDRLGRVPDAHDEIKPDSELAQRSLQHVARVVEYLGREYGGREYGGQKQVSFSLNEPFHGFGEHYSWTMSEAYLEQVIGIVEGSGRFPGAGWIVNSAQGLDLERIADFFEALIRKDPSMHGRLTSGFDIYPFLPPVVDFPVLGDLLGLVRSARRNWEHQAPANLDRARDSRYGYRIEITEAQAEPFAEQQVVGNSLPHYQHVLAQCLDRILDPAQDASVIRMYGVEYQLRAVLTGKATQANHDILDLTRRINAMHSA